MVSFMKISMFLIVFTLISSINAYAISFIDEGSESILSDETYIEFIEEQLKNSLDRAPQVESKSLYLKYITIGFSMDMRIGLFGWKQGAISTIEFHMKAPKPISTNDLPDFDDDDDYEEFNEVPLR